MYDPQICQSKIIPNKPLVGKPFSYLSALFSHRFKIEKRAEWQKELSVQDTLSWRIAYTTKVALFNILFIELPDSFRQLWMCSFYQALENISICAGIAGQPGFKLPENIYLAL